MTVIVVGAESFAHQERTEHSQSTRHRTCHMARVDLGSRYGSHTALLSCTGWPKNGTLVSGVAGLSASSSSKADTLNI